MNEFSLSKLSCFNVFQKFRILFMDEAMLSERLHVYVQQSGTESLRSDSFSRGLGDLHLLQSLSIHFIGLHYTIAMFSAITLIHLVRIPL